MSSSDVATARTFHPNINSSVEWFGWRRWEKSSETLGTLEVVGDECIGATGLSRFRLLEIEAFEKCDRWFNPLNGLSAVDVLA